MELSRQLAAQIVSAVFEVVKNDINLMNASGIIIGSTNPERVGTFHEAGYQAILRGAPVIVEDEHSFRGAQRGINYPIFAETAPVAAIGITGPPGELEKFGFLVTKITEVFLKEQQLNKELLSKSRSLHYLVTSLLYDNIKDQKQLEMLLDRYGLDREGEYAALTIKMENTSLEQSLRFYFKALGCPLSIYLYPSEWAVIFDREGFERFSPADFACKYDKHLHSGMGPFGPLYRLNHSYQSAVAARRHARRLNAVYCNSEDISIEFVLESIPPDIRRLYWGHILKALTEREIHLLKAYFGRNLSLKETAEALNIHKNTLQYQLDKITEKSGLNPRIFQDAFLLKFALLGRGDM